MDLLSIEQTSRMNRLWEHNMGDAMRENKQLWRKRRGWMDEGEKRLTDWRSFLGPERDFREMENLRRVRWLVLGCGWLMGCLGVAQDVLGCPSMSPHLPQHTLTPMEVDGMVIPKGTRDPSGDPKRDPKRDPSGEISRDPLLTTPSPT